MANANSPRPAGDSSQGIVEMRPPTPSARCPAVYAAICKVIADMGREGISKDRKNAQQGYSFRGIDDVYNALNGALSRHGLCILPRVISRSVTEQQSRQGGMLFYVVLDVEFDLVSAEDGSIHTIRAAGEAMDSGDKATNKAMSAAYKYACMQTFCIPTEGDNDADATTHQVVARPAPAPDLPDALDVESAMTILKDHGATDGFTDLVASLKGRVPADQQRGFEDSARELYKVIRDAEKAARIKSL